MVIVLLADGFEELEALSPVDILRREGIDVKTVGIYKKEVIGSHGITVISDLSADEVDLNNVDTAIFPGGMPGTLNLDAHPYTDEVIKSVAERGGILAAICAAPLILGKRGYLKGKEAIKAEFDRLLPVIESGRYIPSMDHQTPPGTTIDDYRYYVQLLKEYSQRACKGR